MTRLSILLLVAACAIAAGGYASHHVALRKSLPHAPRKHRIPFHAIVEGSAPVSHDELDIVDDTLLLGWGEKLATRMYFGSGQGAYIAEEYWCPTADIAAHRLARLVSGSVALPPGFHVDDGGRRRELFLRFDDREEAVPAIVLREGRRLRIIHGLPLTHLRTVEKLIAPLPALLPDSLPVLLQRTLDNDHLRGLLPPDRAPTIAADERLAQILPHLLFQGRPLQLGDRRRAELRVSAITLMRDYARIVLDVPQARKRFAADYLHDRDSWELTGWKEIEVRI